MLKYNSKDTEKMINVFAALAEKQDNPTEISNEIVKLIDYSMTVLQEFLKCMEVLAKLDENYIEENYMGVIGYVTLRINSVEA